MRPASTDMKTINPLNLHPCRACESEDVDVLTKDKNTFVACLYCGASGRIIFAQMGGMTNKEAAIKYWQKVNNPAKDQLLEQMAKALKARLEVDAHDDGCSSYLSRNCSCDCGYTKADEALSDYAKIKGAE